MRNDPEVAKYFAGMPGAEKLFAHLMKACAAAGDENYLVQKSDIALGAPRHFGYAWLPIRAVGGRPRVYLVLTLRLGRRIDSPRFTEIVEATPGRYAHHLILSDPRQLDEELLSWMREARSFSMTR